MVRFLEIFLNHIETINIDDWNDVVHILHQEILILFVIGNKCFVEHLKSTIQGHLNRDQFSGMRCTSQEDGWSCGISFLGFLLLICVCISFLLRTDLLIRLNKGTFLNFKLNNILFSWFLILWTWIFFKLELSGHGFVLCYIFLHKFKGINFDHIDIPILPRLANALNRYNFGIINFHGLDKVCSFC